MNDHIIVSFEAESSVLHNAVQAWVDYIKDETLAVDVRKTPIGDADKVVEISVSIMWRFRSVKYRFSVAIRDKPRS